MWGSHGQLDDWPTKTQMTIGDHLVGWATIIPQNGSFNHIFSPNRNHLLSKERPPKNSNHWLRMSKKIRYFGKWVVSLTHRRCILSFDNKGLGNPRLLGRMPGPSDYDPTKKTGLYWCSVLIGRKEGVNCSDSALLCLRVDDWRAWWEDDTYSNMFVPYPNLMLLSRLTRWSLW